MRRNLNDRSGANDLRGERSQRVAKSLSPQQIAAVRPPRVARRCSKGRAPLEDHREPCGVGLRVNPEPPDLAGGRVSASSAAASSNS